MTSSDSRCGPQFERRPGYPMSFSPATKHVRVEFAATTVVDACHAIIMFEDVHEPVYYFRPDEIRMDLLSRTTHSTH